MHNKKQELLHWVSNLDDPILIDRMLELKESSIEDWWDDTSESEKAAIERGIKDADSGNIHPHSKAKNIYKKWL
ncbi:MAG: hypothetical protein ACPGWM_01415 [Flavobacteriales bacterium]